MAEKKELLQLTESRENIQLAAIQEVSEAIASKLSIAEILEVITKAAVITFEASSAWVMMKEAEKIRTVIARGRDSHTLKELIIHSDQGILGEVWNNGKVEIIIPGRMNRDEIIASLLEERESLILIPLGGREKKLGMLACIVPQKLAVSMRFLITLAGQATLGIEKARLSRSLADKTSENVKLLKKVNLFNEGKARQIKQDFYWSNSPAMGTVYHLVERVNLSPSTPVLLGGETGTGKELIANYIHYGTQEREKGSFLELNCASLSENLLESELFGHEKGAFTDAKETKKGLLELANQGTLFLDEIGDMSLRVQARLLRVLENMNFRRVGGIKDIQVEFRLVAATNKDLEIEVERGNFRRDLFHRLKVICIDIPPLRERKDDIIPLAKFFLEKFTLRLRRVITGLSPLTAKILIAYDYPGNIRELKNIIERGVIMETDSILHPESLTLSSTFLKEPIDLIASLPSLPALKSPSSESNQLPTLKQVEKEHIKRSLDYTGRNKTRTSKLLGISYPTLDKKIKDYNL